MYHAIRKITTSGSQVYHFTVDDPNIKDLAWDSTYIWAINTSGTIKQFTTDGALVDSIAGLLSSGWGLTYGDGYLWASNPVENMIYQIALGDVSPPTMEAILEPQGQYYNSAPSFSNFGFDDDFGLDDGWYQIDSYTGVWIPLFTDVEGTEWNYDGWTLPGFDTLPEGSHTIYFKASDDAGNTEGESGEWSWQFYKDVTPPVAFSLIAPADHIWVNVTRPMFIWHAALDQLSGISEYKIYVDETLRDSSADTLWVPNFDLYEGYHDWYVVAYDSAGNYLKSQELFTFGIDTTAPILYGTTVWSDTSFQGPYFVTTNVSETLSWLDSVLLYYRFDDEEWQYTPMYEVRDLIYGAEIPKAPNSNTTICYYLKAKDRATNATFDPKTAPDSVYSFVGWVGIAEANIENVTVTAFALLQNCPNPFRQSTVISYKIKDESGRTSLDSRPSSLVSIKIYDLTGRLVRTLVNEPQQPGHYKVSWDGLDDGGRRVINGIYIYRMTVRAVSEASYYVETKKMVLLGY